MALTTIYHFPIDGQGNETGEVFPITLNADGSADISKLPEEIKKSLERMGTQDEMHLGIVRPNEGERFMNCLLKNANGYQRFRSNPEPIN